MTLASELRSEMTLANFKKDIYAFIIYEAGGQPYLAISKQHKT